MGAHMQTRTFAAAAAILAVLIAGCAPAPDRVATTLAAGTTPAPPILAANVLRGLEATPRTPNTADGVDVDVTFRNVSSRTIKYVHIVAEPINAVGDVVASSIGQRSAAKLTVTGPIEPGKTSEVVFDTVWYNPTIRVVRVNAVNVEFTDDSSSQLDISAATEPYVAPPPPTAVGKSRNTDELISTFRRMDPEGEFKKVRDKQLIKLANRMCDHPDYDGYQINDSMFVDVPEGVDEDVRPVLFAVVTHMYC